MSSVFSKSSAIRFADLVSRTDFGLAQKSVCENGWTERHIMSKNELRSSGKPRTRDFANCPYGDSELFTEHHARRTPGVGSSGG